MDEVSRAHLEAHAIRLAPWAEVIPEHCAVVRVGRRWDRFVDGSAQEQCTADFAREADGPALSALLDETARGLADVGLKEIDFDDELERRVYASPDPGEIVRLWPAESFLLESLCRAIRVDLTREVTAHLPTVPFGPLIDRIAEHLGLDDPMDVTSEVFLDPEALDRVQATRDTATFPLVPDLPSALEELGFDPPDGPEAPWMLDRNVDGFDLNLSAFVRADRITFAVEASPSPG
jgi:hypothetical protein